MSTMWRQPQPFAYDEPPLSTEDARAERTEPVRSLGEPLPSYIEDICAPAGAGARAAGDPAGESEDWFGHEDLLDRSAPEASPILDEPAPSWPGTGGEIVPVAASPLAPYATPCHLAQSYYPGQAGGQLASVEVDRCAVASAVCGLTAVIPVVSQVAGLALGVLGLSRIHRARRRGQARTGTTWALAGIVSSGIALLAWVGILAAGYFVSTSLSDVAGPLKAVRLLSR
jgi:hypothetical protein